MLYTLCVTYKNKWNKLDEWEVFGQLWTMAGFWTNIILFLHGNMYPEKENALNLAIFAFPKLVK